MAERTPEEIARGLHPLHARILLVTIEHPGLTRREIADATGETYAPVCGSVSWMGRGLGLIAASRNFGGRWDATALGRAVAAALRQSESGDTRT